MLGAQTIPAMHWPTMSAVIDMHARALMANGMYVRLAWCLCVLCHDACKHQVVPQIACQYRWVLKRAFGCVMPALELRVRQLTVSQPASARVVSVETWRMRAAVSGLSDLHAAVDMDGLAVHVASLHVDRAMSITQAAADSMSDSPTSSMAIAHVAASVVRSPHPLCLCHKHAQPRHT